MSTLFVSKHWLTATSKRRVPSGPVRHQSVPVCSQEPTESVGTYRAKGCASPTCLPLAHNQAGVIENLLLIIVADDLALAEVGYNTGRIYHRDELHPEVLQVIPTGLIVVFFQHVDE